MKNRLSRLFGSRRRDATSRQVPPSGGQPPPVGLPTSNVTSGGYVRPGAVDVSFSNQPPTCSPLDRLSLNCDQGPELNPPVFQQAYRRGEMRPCPNQGGAQ